MTIEDLPAIVEMGREMHQESKTYQGLEFSDCRVKEVVKSLLSGDYFTVVAEINGRVVGMMAGLVTCPNCSYDLMAVDVNMYLRPEARGTTAGARMVQAYVEWAQAKGAKQITVGVTAGIDNDKAIEFYEALGFHQDGARLSMEG